MIVLIVIQYLNEATLFSLFNAMQVLSIRSRKNPTVVFIDLIDLIVLIVTQCLSEVMLFSLINAMQFLSIPIMEHPVVILLVLIVIHGLSDDNSFIC